MSHQISFPAPKSDLTVLLLGAGGREHALAFKLAQSPRVARVVVCPGNGGTALMGGKVENLALPWGAPPAFASIVEWSQAQKVDLVVPGPEQPLVDGVEGAFKKAGIAVFGPSPAAAMLEGSKSLSKEFMARHNVPTAAFRSFLSNEYSEAAAYINSNPFPSGRAVIKASGLAGGKGVLIPETNEEAIAALKSVMVDKEFGDAGDEVVVEEYLTGPEISILAFCDGYTIVPMPAAQDHKRIGEGDTGLNTGGMGAYAPAPIATKEIMDRCVQEALAPTIKGMREEGYPFVGMLFTGFMLTANGPKVLEYNVRFGDPETEALMLLLDDETDLAEVLTACVERRLDSVKLDYKPGFAISVILASGGYPGSYPKGVPIDLGSRPQGVEVFHAGTKLQNTTTLTDGGRVLAVSAYAPTLRAAVDLAYSGVDQIAFEGKTYRRDIAYRALSSVPVEVTPAKGLTYAAAGVDVDAGNDLVDMIKPVVKATKRAGTDSDIGGFGGAFDLAAAGFRDPVLVSGTDGVGTKLRVALDYGKHNTVGIDLVAMSVNDLIVQGAEPLYFLDYYACSKLDVPVAADVITGIAEGCLQAGCALIGGETAEMPGMYHADDYDLAGFAVGAVERNLILPTPDITSGDVLIGLASSGPHSNGFSLIRKILAHDNLSLHSPAPWDESITVGESLLTPTKVYIKGLLPGIRQSLFKGMSHITGGGFTENIPRVFSTDLGVTLDLTSYKLPAVWKYLMKAGNVEAKEMVRTFNCGVGMVIIVSKEKVEAALASLKEGGEDAWVMGEVKEGKGVEYIGLDKFGL
ncbi:phosphoribosylamine-glycine ligase [Cryptococcus amylolentus CBS 6039]|uniref:Phosphoribosylamine-glycine ligase n=2 Tax=Cryptococcus amylolentus TaxID=104669 RepID=A0A1E3HCR0_9TREE|nr:phosphoribosylamine-glycine ligase [Cryptococcus amylolentus CBS 6039]ODN74128.1 phosphoribosylamine-glycine ligase [Cryptococcus amylolentus CBS 6039]ODO00092.1 phosphoribosylamine-glycine ligase [Cryptococcus amylolentus CBS 6273]